MELNVDCMRAIMLEIEKQPLNSTLRPKTLKESLPDFESDDIDYAILKLNEAGFINATIPHYDNGYCILSIESLTYNGHQFLETIRDNKVWRKTKNICGKIGSFAIDVITKVASGVISDLIKSHS